MADTLTVSGAVLAPIAITPSTLTTVYTPSSVTIGTGTSAVTYTGVSVYNLITAAQFLYPTASGVKNGMLQDYVVATGAGGAQIVLSEGEIDPSFGGKSSTDIIATTRNGVAIAPTLIVPGDLNGGIGGRDISGITDLTVGIANIPAATPGASAAPGVTVSGNSLTIAAKTYSAAAVQQLGQVSQTDTFLSGTTASTTTFTGVPISALLAASGEPASTPLNSYVVAAGTDGYGVVYSGGEINPAIRGTPSALVAYSDGTTNTVGGVAGALRTTAPSDSKGGRYISLLDNIQVVTPTDDTIARLYEGAFGRTADAGGNAFWSGQLSAGMTQSQIAQGFLQSSEFTGDGGAAKSSAAFVAQLYSNLLGRAADQGGASFWTGLLASGTTQAALLGGFASTPEAIIHGASSGGSLIHTS